MRHRSNVVNFSLNAFSGTLDPVGVLSMSASVVGLSLLKKELVRRVNLLDLTLNDLMMVEKEDGLSEGLRDSVVKRLGGGLRALRKWYYRLKNRKE